jgi:hypothetical protein
MMRSLLIAASALVFALSSTVFASYRIRVYVANFCCLNRGLIPGATIPKSLGGPTGTNPDARWSAMHLQYG